MDKNDSRSTVHGPRSTVHGPRFTFFTLAWRNLWRNKRRTLITLASISFAVFFAIVQRGLHGGSWQNMLDNVLHSYTGYLQVHAKGYWDEKTFDYTFELSDSLSRQLSQNKNVKSLVPRVESFALASAGNKTKGVIVAGIDPAKEEQFSKLSDKIKDGSMLLASDTAIVVSQRFAHFMNIAVGDTLTLIGQGYQGASANGIFVVKGIVKLPSPEWDNQMVFMPLNIAQSFYSCDNRLTSLVIDIEKPRFLDQTTDAIAAKIDLDTYEVMTWRQMLNELYQQYVSDEGGGILILGLLYLIVGFGIFGTVMMMTAERTREFGVMLAIGTSYKRILSIVCFEMLLIATMGIILGMIGSLPLITYWHFNPIQLTGEMAQTMEIYGMEPVMPVLWQTDYIINQGIAVFVLTFFAVLYPIFRISRLNVIKALRS